MKVQEVCERLNLQVLAGSKGLDKDISGIYICDLLSWVMSHAVKGNAWITVQTHSNIVAVATLLDMSCIIIPEDIEVEADTIAKANEEEMPILKSALNSFDIAKAMADLGLGR